MSEKRKIEDKDLKDITGAGKQPPPEPRKRVVGGAGEPDTNAEPGDNQNFTD